MTIKSAKEYHVISIVGMLLICVVAFVILVQTNQTVFAIIMILPNLLIVRYWISVGRSITMDRIGCTVQFLTFRHTYKWTDMKTKRVEYYGNCLRGRHPYKSGVVLSVRELRKSKWMMPDLRSALSHPFSTIYVYFDPHMKCEKWNYYYDPVYMVEEVEFKLYLNSLGIKLEETGKG